ncbi:hypothetical protein L208DRAFT_1163912, partial [Tricholoma matsutake]
LSQNILQKAREEASKKVKYDSVKMRTDLCKLFSERESRFSPCEWQLDVAEALLLGIDTVVYTLQDIISMASTGSGKTLCFLMPLLFNGGKLSIIVMALNLLGEQFGKQLEAVSITAVSV